MAVQPLVLLAFPVLAAAVGSRRLPGFLARAAAPAVALLAAAAANWAAAIHAVTSQPNYPAIDHPTPWLYLSPLAPHLAGGSVAAGPARALALRTAFEPVMVSYYVRPPLAVSLVAASRAWSRLLPAAVTAIVLTFLAQGSWRNPWLWWVPVVVVLGLTLAAARPRRPPAAQVLAEPGERPR